MIIKGEPKGWLKEMVEGIDQQRQIPFKYWFLKNYEVDYNGRMQGIPLEALQSIMYNLLKSYKESSGKL